jgi:RNA polymerase sigma-70 factor (ECF subfamily)
MFYLEKSATGEELSEFHLLAGIAAVHATAPRFEATNWKRILFLYDKLYEMNSSSIVALNRSVAVCFVKGPLEAIEELQKIEGDLNLKNYTLLPATLADFYRRAGMQPKAVEYYSLALALAKSDAERKFLHMRIKTSWE